MLTFPFDVLRRKMQVVGMQGGGMGYQYSGAIDALRVVIHAEGFRGLYRGLWPNLRESVKIEGVVTLLMPTHDDRM